MTHKDAIDTILEALRGAGEATRLRILAALRVGEMAVSELTQVLGQSQPRISRHLKLLTEAGLIERRREGSWAFFRLSRAGFGATLTNLILDSADLEDPQLSRDRERLERVRARRAEAADAYFRENAEAWDSLRAMHASEDAVEDAALAMLTAKQPFERFIDLGAGTGRMLELFARRYISGIGYDTSQQMLAVARSRLDAARIGHAELRQDDILSLPEPDDCADAMIVHQVLHFLSEPGVALKEAARVLRPGAQLLIVDFAPHDVEELREKHAHRRLGFEREELEQACAEAGLVTDDYREIPAPEDAEGRLNVSLWRAYKPITQVQAAE